MLNLGSTPERSILRVGLSALVMNFPPVGEGEDTRLVLSREAFCRAELIFWEDEFIILGDELISWLATLPAVLPLAVDDHPVGEDLSGAPGLHRVLPSAGVVGDALVGEGEDAAVPLNSPAL